MKRGEIVSSADGLGSHIASNMPRIIDGCVRACADSLQGGEFSPHLVGEKAVFSTLFLGNGGNRSRDFAMVSKVVQKACSGILEDSLGVFEYIEIEQFCDIVSLLIALPGVYDFLQGENVADMSIVPEKISFLQKLNDPVTFLGSIGYEYFISPALDVEKLEAITSSSLAMKSDNLKELIDEFGSESGVSGFDRIFALSAERVTTFFEGVLIFKGATGGRGKGGKKTYLYFGNHFLDTQNSIIERGKLYYLLILFVAGVPGVASSDVWENGVSEYSISDLKGKFNQNSLMVYPAAYLYEFGFSHAEINLMSKMRYDETVSRSLLDKYSSKRAYYKENLLKILSDYILLKSNPSTGEVGEVVGNHLGRLKDVLVKECTLGDFFDDLIGEMESDFSYGDERVVPVGISHRIENMDMCGFFKNDLHFLVFARSNEVRNLMQKPFSADMETNVGTLYTQLFGCEPCSDKIHVLAQEVYAFYKIPHIVDRFRSGPENGYLTSNKGAFPYHTLSYHKMTVLGSLSKDKASDIVESFTPSVLLELADGPFEAILSLYEAFPHKGLGKRIHALGGKGGIMGLNSTLSLEAGEVGEAGEPLEEVDFGEDAKVGEPLDEVEALVSGEVGEYLETGEYLEAISICAAIVQISGVVSDPDVVQAYGSYFLRSFSHSPTFDTLYKIQYIAKMVEVCGLKKNFGGLKNDFGLDMGLDLLGNLSFMDLHSHFSGSTVSDEDKELYNYNSEATLLALLGSETNILLTHNHVAEVRFFSRKRDSDGEIEAQVLSELIPSTYDNFGNICILKLNLFVILKALLEFYTDTNWRLSPSVYGSLVATLEKGQKTGVSRGAGFFGVVAEKPIEGQGLVLFLLGFIHKELSSSKEFSEYLFLNTGKLSQKSKSLSIH